MGNDNPPFEFEGVNPFADPYLGKDLGPFHIESTLGQGGMGVVYKGIHRNLQRPVAIKVLSSTSDSMDGEAITRFHQEALAYAKVRHPNVVEIYESGEEEGTHYLAIELVEGKSLAEIMKEQGPLEDYHLIELGEQLCGALTNIHAAGLVHRDIKLGNVMISETGLVKLMDFGVVRARTGKGAKKSAEIGGTLRCMAPEVVEGEPGDSRSDIFQLGALFYELLTGETFSVLTPKYLEDIEQSFFRGTATEVRPDVSDALKELILRCLQRSPALRFQSAGVVARELIRVRKEGADHVSRRRLKSVSGDKHEQNKPSLFNNIFSWLRNQYRLNPQPFAIVLFSLVIITMAFITYSLLPEEESTSKEPLLASNKRVLQLGESVEVKGLYNGFVLSWDLGDIEDIKFHASFRVAGGEPLFINTEINNLSGKKFFPIEGTDPELPTSVGWRLLHQKDKVAGGSSWVGFYPLGKLTDKATATSVLAANSVLLVGTNNGQLSCYDLSRRQVEDISLWQKNFEKGKNVNGLFYARDRCYASIGTETSAKMVEIGKNGKGESWFSEVTFGSPAARAEKIGKQLYWFSSVATTGRNFISCYSSENRKKVTNKIVKGQTPLSPLALGEHLFIAYNRKNRGVIARLHGKELKRLWHHVIDEPIMEPLLLDDSGAFLYFKSQKHLHRLRLFEKVFQGKRQKSFSLGDYRKEVPSVSSRVRMTKLQLLLAAKDVKSEGVKILSLPVDVESHKKNLVEFLMPKEIKASSSLEQSPAPLIIGTRYCLAIGDKLYVFLNQNNAKMSQQHFSTNLVELMRHGQRLFVVLANGHVFSCKLPD